MGNCTECHTGSVPVVHMNVLRMKIWDREGRMIEFIDEKTYKNVDAFWESHDHWEVLHQLEINQQLFAEVMGWA